MTYELAKKLKEAGFPQGMYKGMKCYLNGNDKAVIRAEALEDVLLDGREILRSNSPDEVIKIPTLSELIDFVDGNDKPEELEDAYINKALLKLREVERK